MTQAEFGKLVRDMKALYTKPDFIPDEHAMNVWYELLRDIPYVDADRAVKAHMVSSKFPPMPADIRERASGVDQIFDESEWMGAWALVSKAVKRANYYAKEDFEKLPAVIQETLGSFETLKEWALLDDKAYEVAQSHFKSTYQAKLRQKRELGRMPENLRKLTVDTVGRLNG